MRADHLPAEGGEAHPGLALTADQLAAAHLELEVHGGEVAAEREDLQADALLLDARPGRPCDPVRVDLAEAVAVLVQRVADGVRAVPERGVEPLHGPVDERLLVALEQVTHLASRSRYRFAVDSAMPKARASSAPFQI
ncbi:MAG: hypothetical protein A2X53_10535 [Candidatus Rokubacteria bacterium GWA2_70_23]|nr:MAG: hypothetical protein A2X53_10535 [Candidatus Rokubacteria bacterium GWA2_70_23]